jgi:hypothetical protein
MTNERKAQLWAEASQELTAAYLHLRDAQSALDELDVPHISENLDPLVESVERFRNLAREKRLDVESEL